MKDDSGIDPEFAKPASYRAKDAVKIKQDVFEQG
jgi:hypothetical protein